MEIELTWAKDHDGNRLAVGDTIELHLSKPGDWGRPETVIRQTTVTRIYREQGESRRRVDTTFAMYVTWYSDQVRKA